MEKKRILFIPFEFLTWERAGTWPYSVHLGIEEGLYANNVDFFTLPSLYEIPSSYPASWLYHAKRLCEGKQFDQVWFFLRHTQLDDEFLEWTAQIAPVRVGFIMESLQILPEELNESPHLATIAPFIDNQVGYMTHVLAYDEQDSIDIVAQNNVEALWCPWSIPLRFLDLPPATTRQAVAAFTGAIYGRRLQFLAHPRLQDILTRPPRAEFETELPGLFDEISTYYYARLNANEALGKSELTEYMQLVRRIRQDVFVRYMNELGTWAANVVLPAGFKGYSNRVVESASARVPVISWDIPNRPRNRQLFEEGKEILLYNADDPESLAAQIEHVLADTSYARALVQNLRKKVIRYHTAEIRVRQILSWIESGHEPDYGLLSQ